MLEANTSGAGYGYRSFNLSMQDSETNAAAQSTFFGNDDASRSNTHSNSTSNSRLQMDGQSSLNSAPSYGYHADTSSNMNSSTSNGHNGNHRPLPLYSQHYEPTNMHASAQHTSTGTGTNSSGTAPAHLQLPLHNPQQHLHQHPAGSSSHRVYGADDVQAHAATQTSIDSVASHASTAAAIPPRLPHQPQGSTSSRSHQNALPHAHVRHSLSSHAPPRSYQPIFHQSRELEVNQTRQRIQFLRQFHLQLHRRDLHEDLVYYLAHHLDHHATKWMLLQQNETDGGRDQEAEEGSLRQLLSSAVAAASFANPYIHLIPNSSSPLIALPPTFHLRSYTLPALYHATLATIAYTAQLFRKPHRNKHYGSRKDACDEDVYVEELDTDVDALVCTYSATSLSVVFDSYCDNDSERHTKAEEVRTVVVYVALCGWAGVQLLCRRELVLSADQLYHHHNANGTGDTGTDSSPGERQKKTMADVRDELLVSVLRDLPTAISSMLPVDSILCTELPRFASIFTPSDASNVTTSAHKSNIASAATDGTDTVDAEIRVSAGDNASMSVPLPCFRQLLRHICQEVFRTAFVDRAPSPIASSWQAAFGLIHFAQTHRGLRTSSSLPRFSEVVALTLAPTNLEAAVDVEKDETLQWLVFAKYVEELVQYMHALVHRSNDATTSENESANNSATKRTSSKSADPKDVRFLSASERLRLQTLLDLVYKPHHGGTNSANSSHACRHDGAHNSSSSSDNPYRATSAYDIHSSSSNEHQTDKGTTGASATTYDETSANTSSSFFELLQSFNRTMRPVLPLLTQLPQHQQQLHPCGSLAQVPLGLLHLSLSTARVGDVRDLSLRGALLQTLNRRATQILSLDLPPLPPSLSNQADTSGCISTLDLCALALFLLPRYRDVAVSRKYTHAMLVNVAIDVLVRFRLLPQIQHMEQMTRDQQHSDHTEAQETRVDNEVGEADDEAMDVDVNEDVAEGRSLKRTKTAASGNQHGEKSSVPSSSSAPFASLLLRLRRQLTHDIDAYAAHQPPFARETSVLSTQTLISAADGATTHTSTANSAGIHDDKDADGVYVDSMQDIDEAQGFWRSILSATGSERGRGQVLARIALFLCSLPAHTGPLETFALSLQDFTLPSTSSPSPSTTTSVHTHAEPTSRRTSSTSNTSSASSPSAVSTLEQLLVVGHGLDLSASPLLQSSSHKNNNRHRHDHRHGRDTSADTIINNTIESVRHMLDTPFTAPSCTAPTLDQMYSLNSFADVVHGSHVAGRSGVGSDPHTTASANRSVDETTTSAGGRRDNVVTSGTARSSTLSGSTSGAICSSGGGAVPGGTASRSADDGDASTRSASSSDPPQRMTMELQEVVGVEEWDAAAILTAAYDQHILVTPPSSTSTQTASARERDGVNGADEEGRRPE